MERAGTEHRVFIPRALSSLSPAALSILERHLGIGPCARATSRDDLYAVTRCPRLGLKKRAVTRDADAAEAPPRDWELKVSRAVFDDGSEALEKFELPHNTVFDDACLGLTEAEREAVVSSAAGGARALLSKRRRTGAYGELVDVQLEILGSRSSWVTWCFETSWRDILGDAGPRARGAALLAALAEADADTLKGAMICSFAGWVEVNAGASS